MKYYINIALILLILIGVSYIVYLQSASVIDNRKECEAKGWTSLWHYTKPGRIYSSTKFCVDKQGYVRYPNG